jgi:hypothetical protein
MTEQEWLASTDLKLLLDCLVRQIRTPERKKLLFAVACCRLVEHLLKHEASRKALAAAERYAEGLIKVSTLTRYHRDCREPFLIETRAGNQAEANAAWAVRLATYHYDCLHTPQQVASALARQAGHKEKTPPFEDVRQECLGAMIPLLRDIVGNPFQVLPACDAAWLEASGGLAGRLAASIYEERRFTELPILADALEDAGCQEPQLLEHLRGPGPHERGCWALDVVLGKG